MKSDSFLQKQEGFISLITVLIILGVVLLISLGISQLAVGEAQMSLQKSQSSQAFYLASLCAEEALMTLKEGGTYTEPVTINQETGGCTIFPIEGNWIVKVAGNFQNQTKKIKIVISQIDPEMIISSWQEVANF